MISEEQQSANVQQLPLNDRPTGSKKRIILSLFVLAIFWSALFYEYWPDLLQVAAHAVNRTREIGSKPIKNPYFEARNASSASDGQVMASLTVLEKQYKAITSYLKVTPLEPLPVVFINGSLPTFDDDSQLVINVDQDIIDTNLAPVFMVLMVEKIKVNLAGQFIPAGGYALQVVEAAGLGQPLTWQPLDAWVVLLRSRQAYIPLEEAWVMKVPSDDNGAYYLLRAMLESGSFMRWMSARYHLGSARLIANGEPVEKVTGKTLVENEAEWLAELESRQIHPKACAEVVPTGNMFRFMCEKMDSGLK